jgi:hypothetical protein
MARWRPDMSRRVLSLAQDTAYTPTRDEQAVIAEASIFHGGLRMRLETQTLASLQQLREETGNRKVHSIHPTKSATMGFFFLVVACVRHLLGYLLGVEIALPESLSAPLR